MSGSRSSRSADLRDGVASERAPRPPSRVDPAAVERTDRNRGLGATCLPLEQGRERQRADVPARIIFEERTRISALALDRSSAGRIVFKQDGSFQIGPIHVVFIRCDCSVLIQVLLLQAPLPLRRSLRHNDFVLSVVPTLRCRTKARPRSIPHGRCRGIGRAGKRCAMLRSRAVQLVEPS